MVTKMNDNYKIRQMIRTIHYQMFLLSQKEEMINKTKVAAGSESHRRDQKITDHRQFAKTLEILEMEIYNLL